MATVHFAPNVAVKFVGNKPKEFAYSLARPKPILKSGDIVIVDEKTAFALLKRGFGEFKKVDEISFIKKDVESQGYLNQAVEERDAFAFQNNELFSKNVELIKEINTLKKSHLDNKDVS